MKEKSFEEALERMKELIEELEEGNLSLKKGIDRFKEGTELLKFCDKELKDAEMSIQKIVDKRGKIGFEEMQG